MTPEQRAKCIEWCDDLPLHIVREKIERAYSFGSGETVADHFKVREVLEQTACLAESLARRFEEWR